MGFNVHFGHHSQPTPPRRRTLWPMAACWFAAFAVAAWCCARCATVLAQETKPAAEAPAATTTPPAAENARYAKFAAQLTGSAFVGHFTVDGQDGTPKEERYELESVTKLPAADMWLFKARIRYGDHDVTVPLPLRVSWAGDTPLIVVDKVTIPGLGTFDSRVVIADDRYAGTWQHGEVGGHLFGRIERAKSK